MSEIENNAQEERARLHREKEAYYEKCLKKAKEKIIPWSVPDDPNGMIRREMKAAYEEYAFEIYHPEKEAALYSNNYTRDPEIVDTFFILALLPAAIVTVVLAFIVIAGIQISPRLLLLVFFGFCLIYYMGCIAYSLFTNVKYNYRIRFKKAAQCKAICDILEAHWAQEEDVI